MLEDNSVADYKSGLLLENQSRRFIIREIV